MAAGINWNNLGMLVELGFHFYNYFGNFPISLIKIVFCNIKPIKLGSECNCEKVNKRVGRSIT